MKTINQLIAIAVIAAASVTCQAEWGQGLTSEYKTIYVPEAQQSGWGLRAQAQPKPVAAVPTPVVVELEPMVAALDTDGDGVVDESDHCQGTAAGLTVDSMGCPETAAVVPEKDWTLSGIQFEVGSDKIKPGSETALNEAAEILKTHTRVMVEIQGHTDNTGAATINRSLSDRRAMAVRRYLMEKGVPAERLEAKGYGEESPVAANDSVDGRAQNRRIQFKVLSR